MTLSDEQKAKAREASGWDDETWEGREVYRESAYAVYAAGMRDKINDAGGGSVPLATEPTTSAGSADTRPLPTPAVVPASPPPAADAEVAGLVARLRSINKKELSVYDLDRIQAADTIDRLTAELDYTAGALEVSLASEVSLTATLAERTAERDKAIEYANALSGGFYFSYMLEAADAVAENRHTKMMIAARDREVAELREALEALREPTANPDAYWHKMDEWWKKYGETVRAALRAKDE